MRAVTLIYCLPFIVLTIMSVTVSNPDSRNEKCIQAENSITTVDSSTSSSDCFIIEVEGIRNTVLLMSTDLSDVFVALINSFLSDCRGKSGNGALSFEVELNMLFTKLRMLLEEAIDGLAPRGRAGLTEGVGYMVEAVQDEFRALIEGVDSAALSITAGGEGQCCVDELDSGLKVILELVQTKVSYITRQKWLWEH